MAEADVFTTPLKDQAPEHRYNSVMVRLAVAVGAVDRDFGTANVDPDGVLDLVVARLEDWAKPAVSADSVRAELDAAREARNNAVQHSERAYAERDAALAQSESDNNLRRSWIARAEVAEAERDAALAVIEKARVVTNEYDASLDAGEHRGCLGDTACETCELNERYREALATVDTSALAARDAENVCPAVGPSDQACIGRREWHEVHSDGIGTTWRDYAGKRPGALPARRRV